jgi:hypothetical protein
LGQSAADAVVQTTRAASAMFDRWDMDVILRPPARSLARVPVPMQLWGYSGNGVSTVTLQGVGENIFRGRENCIKPLMYLSKARMRPRFCASHHRPKKIFPAR